MDSKDSYLTSKSCREAFEQSGYTYADIDEFDLDALQGYIAIECACAGAERGHSPRMTLPTRKADSMSAKFKDGNAGLRKAFIRIELPYERSGREAISFNEDGFIGFCGWADTTNAQPFYRAFLKWLTEWLPMSKTMKGDK